MSDPRVSKGMLMRLLCAGFVLVGFAGSAKADNNLAFYVRADSGINVFGFDPNPNTDNYVAYCGGAAAISPTGLALNPPNSCPSFDNLPAACASPRCSKVTLSNGTQLPVTLPGGALLTAMAQTPAPVVPPPPGPSPRPTGDTLTVSGIQNDCQLSDQDAYLQLVFLQGLRAANIPGHSECEVPRNLYDNWHDKALLFFDETGSPLFGSLPKVDEDDTLYVIVAVHDPNGGATIKDLKVTQCTEGAEDRILGSLKGVSINVRESKPPSAAPQIRRVVASKCGAENGFGASISISTNGTVSTNNISVKTLALHRFSVGLGVIYDFAKEVEFRTSINKGDSVPTIIRDEHTEGIGITAFVSLRIYRVDAERIRPPAAWFSPAVGISLTDPLDNVYLGINFEPLPGFGVLGGYHFHTVQTLAGGFQVGDHFPAGQIPTDKRWASPSANDFFVGLILDATLLTSLIKALTK